MQQLRLLFEISPWFILLCLLAGAVYAFVLYQKNSPWSKKTNYLLAGLRFLLVSIMTFLLLGPFIKQINNTFEKPAYVFAIDNSLSISAVNDSIFLNKMLNDIGHIGEELSGEDFKITYRSFDQINQQSPDTLNFDHQVTDLDNLLRQIQSDYEGRNLAGVILFSDGIYNQGISPSYANYNFPVHSVALGDTIPKKDLNLKAVYYNKISYQGNKFPLVAEVTNNGFSNEKVEISVKQNGKSLASKTIDLKKNNETHAVEFLLEGTTTGMQHYTVEIAPQEEEFTHENNIRHAYVDVIEGKEKILITAASPHPDIKAISSALEKNKNYDVELYIPAIGQHAFPSNTKQYDLVIFHQVPGMNSGENFKKLINESSSAWFILGNQSDLREFNQLNDMISISALRDEKDKVFPAVNNSFDKFKLSSELRSLLSKFNPVTVPFGRYESIAPHDILLYQQVGSVTTNKPLLTLRVDGNKKSAVMTGEGMWQWRLQEYATTGKHEAFDELISKLVQYLASKEDKRKFRVYPIKNEFNNSEPVIFETEVYNAIYEPIYGQKIDLQISDENDSLAHYSYTTNENNTQYRISGLRQGVYRYTASASINGQKNQSEGEFTITELQLENLNLTANHQLLRNLSHQTNGNFYFSEQLEALTQFLKNKEVKSVIYSDEEYLPIINIKWLFFLLLGLVSVEWFMRKYSGSY